MWVVVGPFDGEVSGDISFQKPKLLKPNTTYAVGRKDQPLLINNKKISHNHCEVIVGPHSSDDTRDLNKRPTLEIFHTNKKSLTYTIVRKDGSAYSAYPEVRTPISDGDSLQLILSISIHFEWRPIYVYASPDIKPPIPLDACADLGIKLVHLLQENITHHLASHYIANLSMAASLLALSTIVKPEWLVEVLRLGSLPRNNEQSNRASLEDHYDLPKESKYRPAFSPSLLPSQKTHNVWQPNEERIGFFSSLRFICLHEKTTQMESELREAIHRGGGMLEMFDIHSGVPRFHKALTRSRAKEGKQTVIVGDIDAMQAAVGIDGWAEIVSEARSFGLEIFSPSKVVQSILEVNLALLESNVTNTNDEPPSSPLPDIIPNSIPEEQSIHPEPGPSSETTAPPRKKLIRRATSRATSREPSMPPPSTTTVTSESAGEPMEPPNRPRRVLTRRLAGAQSIVTGLDDPSDILDNPPDLNDPEVPSLAAALTRIGPTPGRKLKRRLGLATAATDTLTSGLDGDSATTGLGETFGGEEPPHKKFRALFEASNPNGLATAGTGTAESFQMMDSLAPFVSSQSQTQAEADTQAGDARHGALRDMGVSSLAVLREEEEETQSTVPPSVTARATKRRLEAVNEDSEMDVDAEGRAESGADVDDLPAVKKRAVENVNAVHRTGTGTQIATQKEKAPGAQPGRHDTDAAFLKALASTKRGKKAEDEFDREFNKLKISKPNVVDDERTARREREEEEWAVLAEFGDDTGLRGNFMVVVEMDVYKKDGDGSGSGRRQKNPTWDGKPNFKKFKKKVVDVQRPKIELFISNDNDYGMGSAYWKGGSSQTQTQNAYRDSQLEWQSQSQDQSQINPEGPKKSRKQQLASAADSDDEVLASQPSRSTHRGTAAKTSGKARSKSKSAANALFLPSDDDDEDENNFRGFGDGGSKDESDRQQQNRRSNAQAGASVDDEQTLRSSAGTRAGATKASSSRAAAKTPAAAGPARKSTRTTSTKTAAKKAAPVIVDDDSDDGAVFRGF